MFHKALISSTPTAMLPCMEIKALLEQVAAGQMSIEAALQALETRATADLGFARVDLDRVRRCGLPETIFCCGKTPEQVVAIVGTLVEAGQNVLGTRVTPETFEAVQRVHPHAVYHPTARCLTLDIAPLPPPTGLVCVVSAGTADAPVAEEAALVAGRMGAKVERICDVGVAGLHRLLPHLERLRAARAVVVVAGMEGALPSVIGGLVDRPIIAVPTSIGYGLHLGGAVALLSMLNTCVPGITAVNVDNGFGAGVAAALINRVGETR